ncbi:MAG: HD domain-containing protein [Gallionellaceae bacterium]|nr:HD domain-containing protein [Gallionellaceae bacterium]
METAFINHKSFQFHLSDFSFRIDRDNLAVRLEQLRTRMAAYPTLIISQVMLQPLFVWLFWEQASHTQLLFWLACSYSLHTVEVVNLMLRRDKLGTVQECHDWHVHFTFFALASGTLWGAAAMLFFPPDLFYQGLMICIMLGLVAGAVTMNPVHPPASFAYLFGIMLPLILRVLSEGDTTHFILALMLVLFMIVVVMAGQVLARTFMQSLQQRFENLDLLQQLTAKEAETQQARKELEIANFELIEHESNLEKMVEERTAELLQRTTENEQIKDTTILALSSLAETRDNETGNHIRRTQHYVRTLANQLRYHPRFRDFLTKDNIEMLFKIAPLHDIGKVGIPDRILHKPGKLTKEEFEIMKTHTLLGGNAISGAGQMSNMRKSPFLIAARQIAIGHHEKWDGSGYPFALSGDNIPIPARLMALADVYDALSSRRVYKSAMKHDDVVDIIVEGRERHFDPDIVDAFLASMDVFRDISNKFRDDDFVPLSEEWRRRSVVPEQRIA